MPHSHLNAVDVQQLRRLPREFYERDVLTLAPALLGRVLVRNMDEGIPLVGRIVEVEAYLGPEDRAAHSYGGRRTARNASMYRRGGHAYVYFTYGMHYCFNVVADRTDHPTACLIRALEPLIGHDQMKLHRAKKISADRLRDTDLCSGPAKLAQALAIDTQHDGLDLVNDERLYLADVLEHPEPPPVREIVRRPRIGVGYAQEWAAEPLRFYLAGNPHVSCR